MLCITYICDAFEEIGCSVRLASPGSVLQRVRHIPKHTQFVDLLYGLLESHGRLIEIKGSVITRTVVVAPTKMASTILQELSRFPAHAHDHQLTALISTKLADCLTGKADGLQIIFGTLNGRQIASSMYGQSPINVVWIKMLEDFLEKVVSIVPRCSWPLKILEMGVGTGGTIAKIVDLLMKLGVPVEYTVTEISSSLVAAARN